MRNQDLLNIFLVCQLVVLHKSVVFVAAEEIDCVCLLPVTRLSRSVWLNQPMLAEDHRREVIDRLMSYFYTASRSYGEVNTPAIAEGVGEVFVHGEDICTGGVTEVEGTVPIAGSVTFCGPVHASGTVTIAGRCAPASGCSPLRIGQPLLPVTASSYLPIVTPVPEPSYLPLVTPVPDILPLPERIQPTYDILPITEPSLLPTVILPPVIIPAITVPAYIIPEVVLPVSEVYELGTGYGDVVVIGNDIIVSGATHIEGVVPTLGEVTFSGYVPAKGTVTVCSCF